MSIGRGFVARTNRLRYRFGHGPCAVTIDTPLEVVQVRGKRTIAEDLVEPAREVVAPQVTLDHAGGDGCEETDEGFQRARAGARTRVFGEDKEL